MGPERQWIKGTELGFLLTPQSSILAKIRTWMAREVEKAPPGHVVELSKDLHVKEQHEEHDRVLPRCHGWRFLLIGSSRRGQRRSRSGGQWRSISSSSDATSTTRTERAREAITRVEWARGPSEVGPCTVSQARGACIRMWKLPEVGVDNGYLGKDRRRTMLPVVAKDRRTKMLARTAVESKGRDDYSTSFMTPFLLSLEWKRFIVRSDNEPSLHALLARVAMNLPSTEMCHRHLPKGIMQVTDLRRSQSES